MIIISTNLDELYLISLHNAFTGFSQNFINLIGYYSTPIFSWTNKMI